MRYSRRRRNLSIFFRKRHWSRGTSRAIRSTRARMSRPAWMVVHPARSASARIASTAATRSATRISDCVQCRWRAWGCASTISPASVALSSAASRAPVFSLSLVLFLSLNNKDAWAQSVRRWWTDLSTKSVPGTDESVRGVDRWFSGDPREYWRFSRNLSVGWTDSSVHGCVSWTDSFSVAEGSSHEGRWLLAECVRRLWSGSEERLSPTETDASSGY